MREEEREEEELCIDSRIEENPIGCVGIGGNDATEGHREWVCQKCFDKQPEINYEYEYSEEGEENEEEPEEETFEEYQKEKESPLVLRK